MRISFLILRQGKIDGWIYGRETSNHLGGRDTYLNRLQHSALQWDR